MSQYDDDEDYDYDDKSDIYNDNEECRGTWLCEWSGGRVVHVEHQCSRCSHSNCIIFVAFVGCFRAVPFEIKSSLGRRNSCGNLHTTLPRQQKQVPKQQG